mgnify:CR=1 FL=1
MVHQYKNNGYNMVLDVASGSVHVVDDLTYEVIALYEDHTLEEIIKELSSWDEKDVKESYGEVTELKDAGVLFTEDCYEEYICGFKDRPTVVKALCLHIAHDCNLACRYCFAEEGEYKGRRALMSAEVGKKALDFLVENSGNRRNLEVDFFGGEPLMNFDVVKEIVAYGRSLEETHDKKFRFTLTTNGVLLNDDIMEFANKEMDNVVLSVDGRKEVHDYMRPFRNGKGSYDFIIDKFKKFADSRNQQKYYVRGTFTHHNLDFSKDVMHLADAGFEQISVEPVVAPDTADYAITEEDLPILMDEYDLLAKEMTTYSNQGAYASHGHAIAANGLTASRLQYACPNIRGEAYTVYTNCPTAGAMRGYGIPQVCFATESFMDDIAYEIGMDPLEFRRKNLIHGYYEDAYLKPIAANTNGIFECLEKGAEYIHWDEKRKAYQNQTGDIRRGVGMALFSYKTGVWPISLEIAGARLSLNQDGSVQLQVGATEIGQGADTVFSQMAAETLHMDISRVHIVTQQDTDVTPFDTGAYASRQSFVTGTAVKECAQQLKQKILEYARTLVPGNVDRLELEDGYILADGKPAISLEDLAMESYYSLSNSSVLTAEVSRQVKKNTVASGCCFAEVEVDMKLGKIKVLDIVNVHDSGTLLNPQLAAMQVHGGMFMGIGYGVSEQLLIDEKTGRPLNGTLLDYKMMTMMDTPDLTAEFVELNDPMGPYGNKALGEPPAIPSAPAIRNAVLHATGIGFSEIPLTPQRLIDGFTKAGLI